MSDTFQPNFFLIIPSHILDDERIDDSTAILFGRISSLSNNLGYCFASDKYLANLCRVSDREIGRRLKILEDCGYIRRETEKRGLHWERKIFPNYNYEQTKRSVSNRPSSPLEPTIRSEEQDKCYKHKTTTTEQGSSEVVVSSDKQQPDSLDTLDLAPQLKDRLRREHSAEKLKEAVKRTLAWEKRNSDTAAILTILDRYDTWKAQKSPAETETDNKRILDSLKPFDTSNRRIMRPEDVRVEVLNRSLEIGYGNFVQTFDIADPKFAENVRSAFERYKLPLTAFA